MSQLLKLGMYAAIMATGAMIGIYADSKIQNNFGPDEVVHDAKTLNLMRLVGLVVFLMGHHLLLANSDAGAQLLDLFKENSTVGKFASVATAGAVGLALFLSFMADFKEENEGKSNDMFTKVMRVLGLVGVVGVAGSFVLPMLKGNSNPYAAMGYNLEF